MIIFGASDAGPAQYLSEIIKKINVPYECYCSNISKVVFNKNKIKCYELNLISVPKKMISHIIVGSTLESETIDFKLLEWGRINKIKTILIIDHWTNFEERISLLNESNFPSELWVNDVFCKNKLVKLNVDDKIIFPVGNPILERLESLSVSVNTKKNSILFISESMNDSKFDLKKIYGFDEYDVLKSIIKHLPKTSDLFIKLHPAESIDKYNSYCNNYGVKIIKNKNLESLSIHKTIIGMNSFLLVELALIGNNVYTYRPNQAQDFIGTQLNLTYNLNERELINVLNNNKVYIKKSSSVSFKESYNNILKRLKI